jgi:hypothetical protein
MKDLALKTEALEGVKKATPNGTGFQINPVDRKKILILSDSETKRRVQ